MSGRGFLGPPPSGPAVQRLYDEDQAQLGFVMNGSRLWAHRPDLHEGIFGLLHGIAEEQQLTVRLRGILIAACASTFGDSYCSLAWGLQLAGEADAETSAAVLRGDDERLTDSERVLAAWARKVAGDPNRTSEADVQELRDAGWTDHQILAITTFIALRVAFSTVNDALGARPDAEFRSVTPDAVLAAVSYGRPIDDAPSD